MTISSIMNIITMIFSLGMECFIIIYYSNSVMEYRYSGIKANIIILSGYVVYALISFFDILAVNVVMFIVINFIVLYIGYDEALGSIAMRVILLTVLMMFGELITAIFMNINITNNISGVCSVFELIIFTVSSKMIYFLGVVTFKRIALNRRSLYIPKEIIALLLLPVSTCIFLTLFNKVLLTLSREMEIIFIFVSIMLIVTNFVVYIVCDRMADNNFKIQHLQQIENKKLTDIKSYQIMKRKYDDMRVVVHDFNKYCKNIEGMIIKNKDEAMSLLRKLENKNNELLLLEYTNNTALNILLTQKMDECVDHGIEFQIYAQSIDLSFIDELDVVAIFANLLDNAIESCSVSNEKKIFLSLYEMNRSYVVIRIDNSADKAPVVNDGKLSTLKNDKTQHGIGMESIKKALSNYAGRLQWSYEQDSRVFNTTILINYYHLKNRFITNVAV